MKTVIARRKVRLSFNIVGLCISVTGFVLCISMIVGSLYARNDIHARITRVDRTADAQFEIVQTAVNTAQKAVEDFTLPERIDETITDMTNDNIERLELLRRNLSSIDIGDRLLEKPIGRIDHAIDALTDIRDNSPVLSLAKERLLEKIEMMQHSLNETRSEFDEGIRKARRWTSLGTSSIVIVALIFLIGQISLFIRCVGNIGCLRRERPLAADDP